MRYDACTHTYLRVPDISDINIFVSVIAFVIDKLSALERVSCTVE
jgi:hypothetical protein